MKTKILKSNAFSTKPLTLQPTAISQQREVIYRAAAGCNSAAVALIALSCTALSGVKSAYFELPSCVSKVTVSIALGAAAASEGTLGMYPLLPVPP